MKKNQMNLRERIEMVIALLGMALFAAACDDTFASQTTTMEGSPAVAPIAQQKSNLRFTSVAISLSRTNAMRSTDCLTIVKPNEIFGITLSPLSSLFALAGNKTCSDVQRLADTPVAYPPTPLSQVLRTIKTIKREPRGVSA